MNKLISGLTAFENSPILNVAKEKVTKALVAGSVLLGSTLLTTGIVPVNVTINGNKVSNVESAEAAGIGDVFYDNWNLIVTHL